MTPAASPVIKLKSVAKVFLTDEVETHALSNVDLEIAQGRIRLDRRPVGLRQVDAAVDPRAARLGQRAASTG